MAVAVGLAAVAGVFVLSGSSDQGSGRTYRVVFDNAFGLVKGGDFRVGGVKAGQTKDFSITKQRGHSPKAVVVVEISQPGFDEVPVAGLSPPR